MIAAIYARKSTEQNVSDDAKSVTRQVELGRAFAAERGWTIIDEFVDDGIPGALANKLVSRARMLASAATEKLMFSSSAMWTGSAAMMKSSPASSTAPGTAAWTFGATPTGPASRPEPR